MITIEETISLFNLARQIEGLSDLSYIELTYDDPRISKARLAGIYRTFAVLQLPFIDQPDMLRWKQYHVRRN